MQADSSVLVHCQSAAYAREWSCEVWLPVSGLSVVLTTHLLCRQPARCSALAGTVRCLNLLQVRHRGCILHTRVSHHQITSCVPSHTSKRAAVLFHWHHSQVHAL